MILPIFKLPELAVFVATNSIAFRCFAKLCLLMASGLNFVTKNMER